jgi:hypothetical protein
VAGGGFDEVGIVNVGGGRRGFRCGFEECAYNKPLLFFEEILSRFFLIMTGSGWKRAGAILNYPMGRDYFSL